MGKVETNVADSRTVKELYDGSKFYKFVFWSAPTIVIFAIISPYMGGPQFEFTDFLPLIMFLILVIDRILITTYEIPRRYPKLGNLMDGFTKFLILSLGFLWFYVMSTVN